VSLSWADRRALVALLVDYASSFTRARARNGLRPTPRSRDGTRRSAPPR
jgi:hypothetical protein